MSWLDPFFQGVSSVLVSGIAAIKERGVNFIAGTGVTITAVDNPSNARTDITIASTGGGSGALTAFGGDLATSTATNQIVSALAYGSAIPVTGPGLAFLASQAAPGFSQASTTAATGASSTWSPQASTATNGTPGNIVASIPAPTGTGTEGAIVFARAGTRQAAIGAPGDIPSLGGMFFGAAAQTAANASMLGNGSYTIVNAPSDAIYFKASNSHVFQMNTSALYTSIPILGSGLGPVGGSSAYGVHGYTTYGTPGAIPASVYANATVEITAAGTYTLPAANGANIFFRNTSTGSVTVGGVTIATGKGALLSSNSSTTWFRKTPDT